MRAGWRRERTHSTVYTATATSRIGGLRSNLPFALLLLLSVADRKDGHVRQRLWGRRMRGATRPWSRLMEEVGETVVVSFRGLYTKLTGYVSDSRLRELHSQSSQILITQESRDDKHPSGKKLRSAQPSSLIAASDAPLHKTFILVYSTLHRFASGATWALLCSSKRKFATVYANIRRTPVQEVQLSHSVVG